MSLPPRRAVAVPLLLLLGLTGCTATAAPAAVDESYAPVPDSAAEPTPAVTANAIEADMTLRIRAIATAANGAQLELDMQVHQATAWDYAGTQTLPAAMVEDCGDTLDLDLFAGKQWSFTRVNVTSIATAASTADWPGDAVMSIAPSGDGTVTAGRGMLTVGDASAALCEVEKTFAGPGRGAIALGSTGDAAALTAWAAQSYGFRIAGATLSDCTIEGTEHGAQFGAASGFTSQADASTCVAVPAS